MSEFDKYIVQGEPDKKAKANAWQTAIGLQDVDGLKPSEYLIKAAVQHIEGDITIDQVKDMLDTYYQTKDGRERLDDERTEEADKVSARITEILSEQSFSFTPDYLLRIHRRLFEGIYKHAGQLRDVNITKKEWVLNGDTVLYSNYDMLRETLEYDFEQEKKTDYSLLNADMAVKQICKFVSGIWQIHPFREGNTRTTAVFTMKWLQTFGFSIDNDVFKDNSWYFRNALVRANYNNIPKRIFATSEYLELFFRNLLMGEDNVLMNRHLHIKAKELLDGTTPTSTPTSSPTSVIPESENIKRLISAIAEKQLSVKEMMAAVGLKDRPNFIEYSLSPAMREGYVRMLYPDSLRHPRQKYLLTVKGLAAYKELSR